MATVQEMNEMTAFQREVLDEARKLRRAVEDLVNAVQRLNEGI